MIKLAHQFEHGAPKERFDDLGDFAEKNNFHALIFWPSYVQN